MVKLTLGLVAGLGILAAAYYIPSLRAQIGLLIFRPRLPPGVKPRFAVDPFNPKFKFDLRTGVRFEDKLLAPT